jgi:hypothetical protein
MGYRRKVYSLKWAEGHSLHGLEVSFTGMSVGRMAKLTSLAGRLGGEGQLDGKLEDADVMFREMAACLVSWNLEDHRGEPVPATYEGLADQDVGFVMDLAFTWMEAVASVDNPLPSSSNGGPKPMPEVSIPMVPLPASPSS